MGHPPMGSWVLADRDFIPQPITYIHVQSSPCAWEEMGPDGLLVGAFTGEDGIGNCGNQTTAVILADCE